MRWLWLAPVTLAAVVGIPRPPTAVASPLRLTIDDAVSRAAGGSSDVNRGRRDAALAVANVARSRAWLPSNPYLSSGAQYTSQYGSNYWFSLAQEFEIAGQRGSRMGAAAAGVRKADWELKAAEQTAIAAVKTTFIQSLVSRERLTLAQKGLDLTADLVRQLGGRETRDLTQQVDLNSAKIQEARSRRDLATTARRYDELLDTLRQWVDVSPQQELELIGAPEYAPRPVPAAPELIERALQQRPDLVARRHEVDQAHSELSLARRSAVPNVSLSGTYLQFQGVSQAGGEVTVPLPVFKSGAADTAEAAALDDFAAQALHAMERVVPYEVIEARRACADAASDLQLVKGEILPRSEDNVRLQRPLYERAVVSLSDFVEVQLAVIAAQGEFLDAVQTYNEAAIELERVVGGPW